MLDTLVETAVSRGITKLVGYYYPTAKNGMVRELYADFGFAKTADNDGKHRLGTGNRRLYKKRTDSSP